jgi:hypothetical protein
VHIFALLADGHFAIRGWGASAKPTRMPGATILEKTADINDDAVLIK